MSMNKEQRSVVVNMTNFQALAAWQDIYKKNPKFPPPPEFTPERVATYPNGCALMTAIDEANMDQADVVLPMCRRTNPEAIQAIEALVGRPITRVAPRGAARPRKAPRASQERPADTRTVLTVAPNPKKPNSASHTRYEAYRVGDTIAQCVARGLTMGDVKWDLDRGFITLGA